MPCGAAFLGSGRTVGVATVATVVQVTAVVGEAAVAAAIVATVVGGGAAAVRAMVATAVVAGAAATVVDGVPQVVDEALGSTDGLLL